MIAADIIDTIVSPTINEMIILAVTVFIRTFISLFWAREIKDLKENDEA